MKLPFRRDPGLARLLHPLDPIPRTAVLAAGFQKTNQIRVFPQGWCCEAERFRPAVIAAPLSSLLALASEQIELSHALIAFSYGFDHRVSDWDRDLLWRAFGVPLFEQVFGPREQLLATECQAHEGLHLMADDGSWELETEACGCGNKLPRLLERVHVAVMAASA